MTRVEKIIYVVGMVIVLGFLSIPIVRLILHK